MKLTTHPPSSAKVKNEWSYSYEHYLPSWCTQGQLALYRIPNSVSAFQGLKVTTLIHLILDKILERTSVVQ
jgi:hypothetical protein